MTNAKHIPALQVAELYKNRWQVELFFKWLKQHLKIKKFWGTSKNAVKIQVNSAIIAYCLVAIMQHDMKLDRSTIRSSTNSWHFSYGQDSIKGSLLQN